jgi:2-dehydropantoate 2-reductase
MRLVIVGAGGVGGYFGARLARAGEDVTFVARGAHLEAIRRDGLRVRSAIEGEFVVRPSAVDTLPPGPPADAVLLCVKGFDTESALAAVRPAVGPATAVLSLQNGVASAEAIDAALGPGHAVGGAAYVFATIEAPGVVAHRFLGRIALGELDGAASPRALALRDAFAKAGIAAELSSDIGRVLWEKYLMIGAQAGMTALTRCPVGVLRERPACWRMYRAIVEELAALGRAAGVPLDGAVERTMAAAEKLAPEATASLHHDLVSGKRLELETLHGYAVRRGERLGVPMPMTSAVYAALLPHVDGRRD